MPTRGDGRRFAVLGRSVETGLRRGDRCVLIARPDDGEALYDEYTPARRMLALCQFDLTGFDGDVRMDALRTRPYCVMGDVVVPNPFHESPEAVRESLAAC